MSSKSVSTIGSNAERFAMTRASKRMGATTDAGGEGVWERIDGKMVLTKQAAPVKDKAGMTAKLLKSAKSAKKEKKDKKEKKKKKKKEKSKKKKDKKKKGKKSSSSSSSSDSDSSSSDGSSSESKAKPAKDKGPPKTEAQLKQEALAAKMKKRMMEEIVSSHDNRVANKEPCRESRGLNFLY
eukprot:gnl/TRDRNA2_/TRDRNA2_53711_c0_seq1.p1 gnl/TRDRNA2_/TRDRNA2_53711_c0~~gnl/TRDRNA2_/TRDRNA2_53711_c0_seq1.p1  ORF type:complete len:182 (-),score=65.29 gnl/TRDRNA2_/TRDRNA2_53711_c0_seq1:89-634(-)